MNDHFHHKADGWDERPVPAQISEGVTRTLLATLPLQPTLEVLDFGAGTGLIASKLAPHVARIHAVDISPAMLAKLADKPELQGKVDIHCQDILDTPLDTQVDLIVSAMALHHVEDTRALFQRFHQHLRPQGRLALADLDTEDGTFHPPQTEGVFHTGFDRDHLGALLTDSGFVDVSFTTACEVDRDHHRYPIFLVTAAKP
ncbi:MAG: class I SAM-dependent methyltransferase [Polyangiaceae bacterium]